MRDSQFPVFQLTTRKPPACRRWLVYSASKAAHGRRGKDRVGQLGAATSGLRQFLRQRLDILLCPGNSRGVATPMAFTACVEA